MISTAKKYTEQPNVFLAQLPTMHNGELERKAIEYLSNSFVIINPNDEIFQDLAKAFSQLHGNNIKFISDEIARCENAIFFTIPDDLQVNGVPQVTNRVSNCVKTAIESFWARPQKEGSITWHVNLDENRNIIFNLVFSWDNFYLLSEEETASVLNTMK